MIEILEITVEVFCPTRKKHDSFYRCGQKWPSGKTVQTIRVIPDAWRKAAQDVAQKKRLEAKDDAEKAAADAEIALLDKEVKAAFEDGCVAQARFEELMSETMVSANVLSHNHVGFTPKMPLEIRKPSFVDDLVGLIDLPAAKPQAPPPAAPAVQEPIEPSPPPEEKPSHSNYGHSSHKR